MDIFSDHLETTFQAHGKKNNEEIPAVTEISNSTSQFETSKEVKTEFRQY